MTLCKTKNLLKSAIILSIFFAFFLGFNNGNVLAATSPIHSVNPSSTLTQSTLCENNDCVGYNYVHIWIDNFTMPGSGYSSINITQDGHTIVRWNFYDVTSAHQQMYMAIPSGNTSYINYLKLDGSTVNWEYLDSLGSGGSSASLNITENGTYDVSSYDVAVVNVPQDVTEIIEDPISNDFQKVFFAIVENIIPAFGIILVVWFGIDMLSSLIFGRGR